MCPKIIGREEQIEDITEQTINYLISEKGIPPATYIYGGSGTGKTYVVKKLFKDNQKEIKKHLPNYEYIYINLKKEGVPSQYTILSLINNQIKKHLPIEFQGTIMHDIPLRGLGTVEHYRLMKEIIRQKKLCIILVIDEIDRLHEYEKVDDLVYSLSTLYEDFEDELFIGMSPIFISNKVNLLEKFEERTRQRIPFRLHFKPYNFDEIYKILKIVAEHAIKPESYDEELLIKVTKEINDGSKSARDAKRLLYHMVQKQNIGEARQKTDMDIVQEEIGALSLHQKISLFAVVKAHQHIQKMLLSPRKHLYHNKILTITLAFETYTKTCVQYQEPFTRMIKPLGNNGILSLDTVSLGRAKGITTKIDLGESYEILAPIIQEEMKHLLI